MVRRIISLVAAFAFLTAASMSATAEGRLEARYAVSITGIPIGQGALMLDLNDIGYTAAGSATVIGLLKLISPGKGSAAARGNFVDGKLSPVTYSLNSESGERWEEIRMGLAAGTVRELSIMPPKPLPADRIPVTDEHRKGVIDPMSAMIMPVAGSGNLVNADACNRTLSIYDGRVRYDLVMNYERTESAKDVKGYSGPLIVCRVAYRPVAGHRPNRLQIKYMVENENIFAWLAPVAGTRALVPVRVSIGTMIGTLVVQATHFSSEPRARTAVNPAVK
ncbi:MAG: DUF3108 domain-containing protein [Xanthobacteraceae bacterium]|nr:DUF3108 domain-containing protein [Xanthobacteraceae bacterium]